MTDEIDYKLIERQLAILMTNSVAFASKLYDMFVSSTPMDVEFNVWTAFDEFETITVPNRAKGNIPANFGSGSPEGVVSSSYGTMYIDQDDGSIYIKTTEDRPNGWLKLVTSNDLSSHNRSKLAHDGVLAKIDGAYSNGVASTFVVADAIDGVEHSTEELTDEYYAVNKGSLFKLLGGLENLRMEDKTNIVNAINETSEASMYDPGCIVNGLKNVNTNTSAVMSLTTDEHGETSLVLSAPFVAFSPSGTKHTFTKNAQINLIDAGVKSGQRYNVYINLDPDTFGNVGKIIITSGKYLKQARKPYVLAEGDGWLDTNSVPYRFILMERDEFGKLIEVEKNYAYLGELEQDIGG